VDELSASRRRVCFGVTLAAAFVVVLAVALTSTSMPTPTSLRVEASASAETLPAADRHVAQHDAGTSTTMTGASTTTTAETAASVGLHPAVASRSASLASRTVNQASPTTTAKPLVKAPPPTIAPPPPPPPPSDAAAAFLACIRQRESHGNYGAVSAGGTYMGAYQFSQSAWDSVARHAGRPELVGQHPNLVSPADQDAMALAEYLWLGSAPWNGACG
jgi:hypothetical protein